MKLCHPTALFQIHWMVQFNCIGGVYKGIWWADNQLSYKYMNTTSLMKCAN